MSSPCSLSRAEVGTRPIVCLQTATAAGCLVGVAFLGVALLLRVGMVVPLGSALCRGHGFCRAGRHALAWRARLRERGGLRRVLEVDDLVRDRAPAIFVKIARS